MGLNNKDWYVVYLHHGNWHEPFVWCLENIANKDGIKEFNYQGNGVFEFKNHSDSVVFSLMWL